VNCYLRSQVGAAADKAENNTDEVTQLAETLGTGTSLAPTFAKDDRVILIEGDLRNMTGRVHSITDGKIMVKPEFEGFEQLVPLLPNQLSKWFAVS
jgi:transcription antitermination factor NusG